MKHLVLIPDGMADRPHPAFNGRTPMEAAVKPNMDRLAAFSECGTVLNVPPHMVPESDTANLAVLSYDPATAPTTVEMETVGVRIGDWTILTVPGELYTEIGLAMKAVVPERKILISEQTNGRYGYIPPDSTLGSNAYGGKYYAGELGYGAKDKMVAAAKVLMEKLG